MKEGYKKDLWCISAFICTTPGANSCKYWDEVLFNNIKLKLNAPISLYNLYVYILYSGGEWDYVILSTVRSLPEYQIDKQPSLGWLKRHLGFITDEHQINVALTRAKRGMIIVGE